MDDGFSITEDMCVTPEMFERDGNHYLIIEQKVWPLDVEDLTRIVMLVKCLPIDTKICSDEWAKVEPVYFIRPLAARFTWRASKDEVKKVMSQTKGNLWAAMLELDRKFGKAQTPRLTLIPKE